MRVTAVGCSGSFPGPDSPASCYLVEAEHEGRTWRVVLDLGSGSLGPLQRYVDPRSLDAVVLSHLHPDHCLDVCGLYVMLSYGPDRPPGAGGRMRVLAPADAPDRLARAYGVDAPEPLDDRLDFEALRPREPVRVGPFTITPVPVWHPVECYGLRVEADGAVLAYTADTDRCDTLDELCVDATLVLADCAYVDGRDDDSHGVHMSGSRAAAAAVSAGGVARLMLTHIPAWNDPRVCHDQAAAVWPGEVEVCRPGQTYEL